MVVNASNGAPLAGQVAIVTGGGKAPEEVNIGYAICAGLAQAGASVVIVDVNEAAAAESAQAIEAAGGRALAVKADISREAECTAAVDAALEAFGRCDVLVNSCGIVGPHVGLDGITEDALDVVMGVNLKGALFMTKSALPRMERGGAVVNLSTISATRPGGGVAYPVSKGALETLTKVTAIEGGPRQIRVNAVAPGMAWTPNAWREMPEERREEMRERFRASTLLGVEGTAEAVATAVVFLAWAPWISAQVLTVDGGGTLVRPNAG